MRKIAQFKEIARFCESIRAAVVLAGRDVASQSARAPLDLALAAKGCLPSEEELHSLRPHIDPPPVEPSGQAPVFGTKVNGTIQRNYPSRATFLEARKQWEADHREYTARLADYEARLPEENRKVDRWHQLHGEAGISGLLQLHKRFDTRIRDLSAIVRGPRISTLPFVILPPDMRSLDHIVERLSAQSSPIRQIVPQRIDHLRDLEPIEIYIGVPSGQYHDYLVFLYPDDLPAILECPFHGNATYIISRNWRTLCQLTKQELRDHADAKRIIHDDMNEWKWAICHLLGKRMPGHSNEY